jgi:glycosyl transferase family 25
MLEDFDGIYIINLAHRTDRWREITEEFTRIGIAPDHHKVHRFDAIRPTDAGDFPTVGTRGCFMSHLGVLQEAMKSGHQRILILEDDLDFSSDFSERWPQTACALKTQPWGLFYGCYEIPHADQPQIQRPVFVAPAEMPIMLAAFVAIQGEAIAACERYLNDMLQRSPGSPDGGPMHVDGAYTWFRQSRPDVTTLVAAPQLGRQRPSRTDIHSLPWYDELRGLRDVVQWARRLKRTFTDRP